jgi:hypothetical protein
MSQFHLFKTAVQKQFDKIKGLPLFFSNADKNELWDTYLQTLTSLGQNEVYRERGEHDCQCCKHFIRKIGNILAVDGDSLVSIWDIEKTGTFYDTVATTMSALTKSKGIRSSFALDNAEVGTDSNLELLDNGKTHVWEHFYVKLPNALVIKDSEQRAKFIGRSSERAHSLKKAVEVLTLSAAQDVLDLINEGTLYRGTEFKTAVQFIIDTLKAYTKATNKELWFWSYSLKHGDRVALRSSVIGTLVEDLSTGVDTEAAVKSYETKVAPANYKRPTALVTKGMIEAAQKKVQELGIEGSLGRRHAKLDDITVNNVIFADATAQQQMKGNAGVFGTLLAQTKDTLDPKAASAISISDFISKIVPKTTSMDVYLENSHSRNLMTLMAPVDSSAPNILKWGNNFTWTYNGSLTDTDTMRDTVVARGGSVDGVFRFTHSWNHTGRNQSLMDLHVFLPTHNGQGTASVSHDNYGNNERVGWNNRKHQKTGGVQDVDYTSEPGPTFVPLENITFPDLRKMPEGTYVCKVHNWKARNPNDTGFKAEIEFEGQVFQYDFQRPLKNKEWVTVAEVTLRGGKFTIDHKIPCGSQPQELWGLTTQKFHRVTAVMHSPNHWDGEAVGNKHFFFMLENLRNPEPARGLYNEYLSDSLQEHRKVLEVVGKQLMAPPVDNQMSGVGFSSTLRNSVVIRTTDTAGKSRLYNVQF